MSKRQLSASPPRARKRQATRSSSPESSNDSRSSTKEDFNTDSEAPSDASDSQFDASESDYSEESSGSATSSSDNTDEEQRLDTEETDHGILESPAARVNIGRAPSKLSSTTVGLPRQGASMGAPPLADTKTTGDDVETAGTMTAQSGETGCAETLRLSNLAEQQAPTSDPTIPSQPAN